jgi:lysozyme
MMRISQNGLDLIKQHESFSSVPYFCPAGKLTIGYGHRVLSGENFTSITEAEAEDLLRKDANIAENCINNAVKVAVTQNQFDALASLAFNIGCRSFTGSTLLKFLNAQDYRGAANQFLRWKYAGGIVLSGLVNRRNLERQLFLKGLA